MYSAFSSCKTKKKKANCDGNGRYAFTLHDFFSQREKFIDYHWFGYKTIDDTDISKNNYRVADT